jgi:uncharacterized protein (TIGR00369 family)
MGRRTYLWADPPQGGEPRRTVSGLQYLTGMCEGTVPRAPMAETIGWRLCAVEQGRVVLELEPAEHLLNSRSVHGGALAALLDSAMAAAVTSTLSPEIRCSTIELKVNFTRPATLVTGRLVAEGKVIHAGREIVVAEARVTDDQKKLYACSTGTFALSSNLPTAKAVEASAATEGNSR